MSRTAAVVLGGTLLGGALVGFAAVPASAAPCDAYSQVCPSTPPGGGGGGTGGGGGGGTGGGTTGTTGSGGSATATTGDLPFTGGEVVLMTVVGLGAVAGGTALVVAGRRRQGTTPA